MVFGLVLIVGVALAGFAVYMAQDFFNQTQSELARERAIREKVGPLVEVYVVKNPLSYGDPLTKEDVEKVYWPKNSLPEGIFQEETALFPGDYTKPRYVVRQMEAFEPLLAVKLTEPGEPAGLTSQLSMGMRAFTIEVDVSSGVSGFLQPGDSVDVYWTGAVNSDSGNRTRLIETALKIVAVDQVSSSERKVEASVARTVTVEVTPEQVARLAQAQATGRLSLSLVGQGEVSAAAPVEVDQKTLLGIEEAVVVEAPQEEVCTTRTRKGSEVIETEIPCTE